MMGWLRKRRLKRHVAELMPTPARFGAIVEAFPALGGFGREDHDRLLRLSAEILAGKTFTGAGGLEPDYDQCLTVATLAALPVLNLGLEQYREFETFILYRDEFMAETEETDEAGVVHRGRDLRAGEAWHRGPVVLALSDVARSGQGQGFNVVVHELAHQLDQLNGEADGFPPLPQAIESQRWTRTFKRAYERLDEELARGEEPFIDPYAAENPAEFFAVASEFFFDVPGWLKDVEPELYALLHAFYRQDPAARLAPASGD